MAFQPTHMQADTFEQKALTYARPVADVLVSGFSASSGTDLFAMVDEATASDTDYFYTGQKAATFELKLGGINTPEGDLFVRYRVLVAEPVAQVTVSLYAGGSLIKADTPRTSPGTYEMVVSPAQYASVSDWSDIRLRFVSA